jgi:hypothetical protein
MKVLFSRACAIALVASLGACATNPADRGVEVTRFHLGQQPIARGQITVEPVNPADAGALEFRTYAAPVERQLARLGWNVVGAVGQSEQVATVHVERGTRETIGRGGSSVNVGVGGHTGGWGSGVGVGVGLGLGSLLGGGSCDVVGTLMEVRIKRRSDGTVFWEGRAFTEACVDSPEAQPAIAAEKLAEALFRDFPGESGRTIRVE